MNFRYYPLEIEIELHPRKVHTLSLESPPVLYEAFMELFRQRNGDGDAFALMDNGSAAVFHKSVDVLCSPAELLFAGATIKKALYQKLTQELLEGDLQSKLLDINEQIDRIMTEFKLTCGYEIEYNLPEGAKDILDGYDVSLVQPSGLLTERLLTYISTVSNLLGKKLFVCCNFGDFFTAEDIDLLKKDLVYMDAAVLFVIGTQTEAYKKTDLYIVDRDQCLIY